MLQFCSLKQQMISLQEHYLKTDACRMQDHRASFWHYITTFRPPPLYCPITLHGRLIWAWKYMMRTGQKVLRPKAVPLCFRGCGQESTMFHIWWTCPKVWQFWARISILIHSITEVNIPKNARMALLDEPITDIPMHIQTLIFLMFMVAKMNIAKSWETSLVHIK